MQRVKQGYDVAVDVNDLVSADMAGLIRVLHVDDDPSMLEVSKQILMMEGNFEIDNASGVDEAFKKLETGNYDVVVSDYEMPSKDGLEFLKELREAKNDVPFILFTGKGREEVAIKALNLGADGYFTKQGSPETVYGELSHGIQTVVEGMKLKTSLTSCEDKFKVYIGVSPTAIFVVNSEGKYEYVNEAASRLLGYSRQELLEMSIPQLLFQENEAEALKKFVEVKETGKSLSETVLKRKDGQPVHVILNSVKLPDGKLIAFCEDITKLNLKKEALEASEAKLRSIVENSSDQIFMLDKDYKYLSVNKTLADVLGKSPKEIIGKSISEVYLEMGAQFSKNIESVFCTGKSIFIEEKMFAQGQELYIDTSLNPVKDDMGEVIAVAGIVRDITERRKAEEMLRESEQRWATTLTSIGDAVIATDTSGKITFMNAEAEKLTSWTLSETFQKPAKEVFKIVNEQTRLEVDDPVAKVLETGQIVGLANQTILIRRDGSEVAIDDSAAPIKTEEAKLIGVVLVFRDITERRKAEQEKERLLRDIGERVKELNGLYGLASLVETPGISLNEVLQGTPDLIYRAYQYPDIACSRIVLEGIEFHTNNFKESPWKQSADIKSNGRKIGVIDVFYLQEKPSVDEGPFLKEERHLLDAVAERLARIIERKKTEETLRESEEKYQTTFESSMDALMLFDGNGFFDANTSTLQMFGCQSAEEFTKYHPADLSPPTQPDGTPSKDAAINHINRAYAVGTDHFFWVHKRIDGTPFPADVLLTRIKLKGKNVLQATVRDITEQKEAEQKLRENSRRIELMNEKLRVVGSLTRHDVRNKLSAVTGYSYLLKKKHADQADIIEGLGKIEQAIKDTVKIFDFAKLYEQLGVEELTYVDAEKTANEAGSLLSGFNLKVVNGCHGLSLLADSLLRQLFYNFMDNTRKYGKKATTVRVYFEKAESGELRLVYEDDGVGISAENKLNLFREGFSTGGSTGVGLFLVRKMLDVYGWAIVENGASGKGAKFTITIPKLNKYGKENFQIAN